MERFFCKDLTVQSQSLQLPEEESRHARQAFRLKLGDSLEITNGDGLVARARISAGDTRKTICEILKVEECRPENSRRIAVAFPPIRPNRMDWAVEKLTELGVGRIQPVITAYTRERRLKKEHLRKISIAAIKQSRQAFMPEICRPLPLAEWIISPEVASAATGVLLHYGPEVPSMTEVDWKSTGMIWLLIGPEGGFSSGELQAISGGGFQTARLTEHILRTETAAVVAAAQAELKYL